MKEPPSDAKKWEKEGFEGDWKVVVRGPNNEELEEISFTIFPNRNLAKQKR